jgi:TP901-1 family phage major tail protein
MAFEKGKEVLLYVSDGAESPTNFTAVAGQQDTNWVPETTTDDITDKTNDGWESTLQVLHAGVITCSGKAKWPDTTGLELLDTAWRTQVDIEAQIVFNTTGKKYTGFFQVTDLQFQGPVRGATAYTLTLRNNGPLTHAAA